MIFLNQEEKGKDLPEWVLKVVETYTNCCLPPEDGRTQNMIRKAYGTYEELMNVFFKKVSAFDQAKGLIRLDEHLGCLYIDKEGKIVGCINYI